MNIRDRADFLEWADRHPGDVDVGKLERLRRRRSAKTAVETRETERERRISLSKILGFWKYLVDHDKVKP